jgi:dGTPase
MGEGKFRSAAATKDNPKWNKIIKRESELYHRQNDIRSEFVRDYNRILHCTAYSRLKHKTQVFFATTNDHICTRIEHVNHVSAVSHTLAKYLGLNAELTSAISIGHDLGHAPFGHYGETVLKGIVSSELGVSFWHEKNSLRFVDKIETLVDPMGKEQNLNLTYAVRDGIVCHCGEVDDESIHPREEYIDLEEIQKPNQYNAYTWEGCIVKVADKISYLGRDIEDAITLNILSYSQLRELMKILKSKFKDIHIREINNTFLMHKFMIDLCEASSPEKGICLSQDTLEFMKDIKDFNGSFIYSHGRMKYFQNYGKLIIESIYDILVKAYEGEGTIERLNKQAKHYTIVTAYFTKWLLKYSNLRQAAGYKRKLQGYNNEIIYDILDRKQYVLAIVDFISSMTDEFAIRVFQDIVRF